MKTKKKLIRLTESDLHRIVMESAKRIIKEEWQTFQAAADKSRGYTGAHGDNSLDNKMKLRKYKYEKKHGKGSWDARAERFHQHAVDAFNRDHGYHNYSQEGDIESYGAWAGGLNSMHTTSMRHPRGRYGDYYSDETCQIVDGLNQKFDDGSSCRRGKTSKKLIVGDDNGNDKRSQKLKDIQQKGDKEIEDYYNGRTTYYKGHGGWQNRKM